VAELLLFLELLHGKESSALRAAVAEERAIELAAKDHEIEAMRSDIASRELFRARRETVPE